MNINRFLRTRLTKQASVSSFKQLYRNMAEGFSYSDRDLDHIPLITFTFVENYIKCNKKSSGDKSINKGFKYYSEGYIQDLRVSKSVDGCQLTGKCYKSQRKNESPHQVKISFKSKDESEVQLAHCSCPIGLSGLCGHIVGTLYQLANYKSLGYKALPEDVARTSQPQTFHVPRGVKIQGKAVQDLEVRGYSAKTTAQPSTSLNTQRNIQSTLYNPVRGQSTNWNECADMFKAVIPNMLMLPALQANGIPLVDSKYGKTPRGSVLSYQQKLEPGFIIKIYDGVDFQQLPSSNVMINSYHAVLDEKKTKSLENLMITNQESARFEKQTRLQSQTALWYRIRKNRITASNIGEIFKRRKEPSNLVKRLKSTRHVTTEAMRQGLASEPTAANAYSTLKGNVNIYPCGVVVNVWAPWLAATPDRKVYNTAMTPPFGLLEIKCPQVSSVLEAPYLQKDDTGTLKLHRNHHYYYQVLAQLAVTGLGWCDFFVWCANDSHCETIYFNNDLWNNVKNKVDSFFFSHFI